MSDYCDSEDCVDLTESSKSGTDILSEAELEDCMPSTSWSYTAVDTSSWTWPINELKLYEFTGIMGINLTGNFVNEIDFFNIFFFMMTF